MGASLRVCFCFPWVEWVVHRVGVGLNFKDTARFFFNLVMSFYIPTSSAQEFQLLHFLLITYFDLFLKF